MRKMKLSNVEVFEQTRDFSNSILYRETTSMKEHTNVIVDGSIYLKDLGKNQVIEVVQSGTVQAILGSPTKVAALNFADPVQPGGLVLIGENTQEECLCRCSNLYESLVLDKCMRDYYHFNSLESTQVFSDRIIYSEDVTFFKNEDYRVNPNFKRADIITCPAPIACNDIEVFIQRIKCILGSAMLHWVDTLILGSWGQGAFENDPYLVNKAFKRVLDEYKCFDKVIFAIKETPGVPDSNYKIAKEVLENG